MGFFVSLPLSVSKINAQECLGGSVGELSAFDSGHDPTVLEFEPCMGLSAVSAELTLDPLSPSLSAPPLLTCMLSVSLKNK